MQTGDEEMKIEKLVGLLNEKGIKHKISVGGDAVIIDKTETKPRIVVYADLLRWFKFGMVKKNEKMTGKCDEFTRLMEMYSNTELMK